MEKNVSGPFIVCFDLLYLFIHCMFRKIVDRQAKVSYICCSSGICVCRIRSHTDDKEYISYSHPKNSNCLLYVRYSAFDLEHNLGYPIALLPAYVYCTHVCGPNEFICSQLFTNSLGIRVRVWFIWLFQLKMHSPSTYAWGCYEAVQLNGPIWYINDNSLLMFVKW